MDRATHEAQGYDRSVDPRVRALEEWDAVQLLCESLADAGGVSRQQLMEQSQPRIGNLPL